MKNKQKLKGKTQNKKKKTNKQTKYYLKTKVDKFEIKKIAIIIVIRQKLEETRMYTDKWQISKMLINNCSK